MIVDRFDCFFMFFWYRLEILMDKQIHKHSETDPRFFRYWLPETPIWIPLGPKNSFQIDFLILEIVFCVYYIFFRGMGGWGDPPPGPYRPCQAFRGPYRPCVSA